MFLNRISSTLRVDFYRKFSSIKEKSVNSEKKYGFKTPKVIFYGKALLNGAGIGLTVGIGYSIYTSFKSKDSHMEHERQNIFVMNELPKFRLIRKVVHPKDSSNLDLVLFQYQTCPFCCKVRAFLDSHSLSYSIVEVDAVLRQDINWSPYKKVPIILARNEDGKYIQLTDSTAIISIISSFLMDPNIAISELAQLYPNVSYTDNNGKKRFDILNKYHVVYGNKKPENFTKKDLDYEREWREWTDRQFIHLISPNVYRSTKESLQTFEWFASASGWNEFFPKWERNLMVYVGAVVMYFVGKQLKKRHRLSENVRQDIYDACNIWTNELKQRKTKFIGGERPSLADLAFFGALMSMEGCQTFSDILTNTSIKPWVHDMQKHMDERRGKVIFPQ